MRRSAFTALVFLATAVLTSASAASAQSGIAQLAGVWVLNTAESDDTEELEAAAEKPAERMPGERGPVRVRVGSRPPINSGAGFGLPRRFDPALLKLAVDAVNDPAARVSIALVGDTVLLAHGDSAPEAFVAHGKKVKRPWLDDPEAEIRAEWKDGGLRIERKLENDLEFEEHWALDPAARRLVVTIIVDGPISRKIELRRIYDAASTP